VGFSAPFCLLLEKKLLSVTAKFWFQVLEYCKTEQSNVRQMHSTASKLDALKSTFKWMLSEQSFVHDWETLFRPLITLKAPGKLLSPATSISQFFTPAPSSITPADFNK